MTKNSTMANGGRGNKHVENEKGNVVTIYKIGNARIKVCDNAYRDKTQEDVKVILARIADRAQEQLSTQAVRAN